MTITLNGSTGINTPGVVNTAAETIATTLAVTGVTTIAAGSAAAPALVGTTGGATTGIFFPAASTVAFATAATERARIDSSGNLLVGTTSNLGTLSVGGNIGTSATQFNIYATGNYEFVHRNAYRMNFYVNSASVMASLSITGVWTNASDARYKENITDSQYGLATVMALKPRSYNLIDQADKPQVGFIAQEVLDVVPEVVDSVHNSVTEEDRYTLSYGNLVAVLTKAIQEQQTLITTLTDRITALENK